MSRKNEWQKLELNFKCNDGIINVYLSFLKRNVSDFSKMKGFVVFAYPQIEKLNDAKNILSFDIVQKQKHSEKSKSTFNHNYAKKPINHLSVISYIKLFIYESYDPLNEWLNRIVMKDTVYRELAKIKLPEKINDEFGQDRIERWKFAKEIFVYEYGKSEKIFGGGFHFLNWYRKAFSQNDKIDYPHNPFLYILLYSGIIGLVLYVILLFQVFRNYITKFKEYYLFFIFFLITYYFSFFSGGNPFDPPMLGFFIFLSFLINCNSLIEEKNCKNE